MSFGQLINDKFNSRPKIAIKITSLIDNSHISLHIFTILEASYEKPNKFENYSYIVSRLSIRNNLVFYEMFFVYNVLVISFTLASMLI